MEFLIATLPDFGQVFHYAFLFMFRYYGWVLFVLGFIVMFKLEYLEEIQGQFIAQTEWTFIEILVPRENKVSTLAVENIFTQMHVLHRGYTFQEKWVEGKFQLWYSLEIVSFGGKVSFIIRTPKNSKHLVESAFYSHYPTAEIHEIEDYMGNFKLDPYNDESEFDFFGTEWKLTEESVIPIKTYKDFEHPTAEEKIVDPLTNLIETMERIKPHELTVIQLLIQPLQNNEWEARAKKKIHELTGEEHEHEFSFVGLLMKPFDWFANFSFKDLFGGGHAHAAPDERRPKNNWLSMTEAEKKRVALIEEKANKPCYNAKIRLLYLAPKKEFDKGMKFEIIGSMRHLSPGGGAGTHNTLKSDMKVWTKVDPYFSPLLEGRRVDSMIKSRKYWFMRGFKNRSVYIGSPKFLLSVEEIATLFHFPITAEGALTPGHVGAVSSKTSRPPANLPVADES